MKERSLNPAHYKSRMPTVEGRDEAAAKGDRKYDAMVQEKLDADAELAQYGIGSTIGG